MSETDDDVLRLQLPEKLEFLYEPWRYKVAYGGRGAARSWSFARALLVMGYGRELRVLCAREIQKSVKDSVHALLKAQIGLLGLADFYDPRETEIEGANGTLFTFAGLRSNITGVKSTEGLDVVWVEEAEGVSDASWDTLIPTVRKDGSEIWVSFNPKLESDATYQRFVVQTPPNAKVVKLNYNDNPWFPDVLEKERAYMEATDKDKYSNIWLGNPLVALEGAIYRDELIAAETEERITVVPYVLGHPVHTFWDLGRSDQTAIWFAQLVGMQKRVIAFYQDRGKHISHYLKVLQDTKYTYGTHYLPHDAQAEHLGAEATIEQQVRKQYPNPNSVRVVPRIDVAQGINLARTVFPECWFDRVKCADGLQSLRHYRYAVDVENNRTSKEPYHDDYSNGADAFRYLAVGLRHKPEIKPKAQGRAAAGWMG